MSASARKVDMSEQELIAEARELVKVFGEGYPIRALDGIDLRVISVCQ